MKHPKILICYVALSICLLGVAGVAQEKKESKKKLDDSIQVLERKKLRQLAVEAIILEIERAKEYGYLKDRITVWTLAADTIWMTDPAKARKLLRDSYSLTKNAVVVKSDKDSPVGFAIKNDNLQRKLKTDILLIAQKRDEKLVKELVDLFEKEDSNQLEKTRNSPTLLGSSSFSKRQLAALAVILAKSDPKSALEYAKASLGFGVPFEFAEVLRNLLASNSEYASELFVEGTNNFLADNSLNLYDGLILCGFLNMTQVSGAEMEAAQRLLYGAFQREQRVWQLFQERNLTDQGLPEVIISTSQMLHRHFQTHYPERTGEVESFIRQVSLALSRTSEFADAKISESKKRDAETLLEEADKERNEENKNALLLEAALEFAKTKDFFRALSVVSKVTDETRRDAVENYLRKIQAEYHIDRSEFNEAEKVIEKIRDVELRVETVVIFTQKARKEKLDHFARQLLVDTQKSLESSFASVQNARAYLWLAAAYTALDPVIGFDLMSSAIRRANQAKDFVELDSSPRIIHLGGKSNQAVIAGNSTGDFRPGFRSLATKNFQHSLLLADNFENKFLRGLAVLATCSAILSEEPKNERAANSVS